MDDSLAGGFSAIHFGVLGAAAMLPGVATLFAGTPVALLTPLAVLAYTSGPVFTFLGIAVI